MHTLLVLCTFDVVDREEMEYGNVAVAILDGHVDAYAQLVTDPSQGDAELMDGAGRRRRTVWSFEPLLLPFIWLLGPSMLALKLFSVSVAGLWAVAWSRVGRALHPDAPVWTDLLWIVPLPLVARAAISATSVFAHLGSSLFHGAALALLVSRGGWWRGPLAGLCSGLGVHQSFSLLPLLPGVGWLAWRRGELVGFLLGLLPGAALVAAFRDPSRSAMGWVEGLTGLGAGGAFRGEVIETAWRNAGITLLYGAGFGRVDPDTLSLRLLPLGWVMVALVAAAVLWRWRSRGGAPVADHSALSVSLGLSFFGFGLAWLATGFRLETGFFDGLRYLLPLAPAPVLLLAWAGGRWVLGGLALHGLGFALLCRLAVFPAPWGALVGYEPWVMRQHLQGALDPDLVHPSRLPRWAVYAGMSAAAQGAPMDPRLPAKQGLEVARHFWLGYGLGRPLLDEGWRPPPNGPAAPLLWEGLGASLERRGCQQSIRDPLAAAAEGAGHASAFWRGVGRAELSCKELDWDAHPHAMELQDGVRAAWRETWGLGGERPLLWLRRLRIY